MSLVVSLSDGTAPSSDFPLLLATSPICSVPVFLADHVTPVGPCAVGCESGRVRRTVALPDRTRESHCTSACQKLRLETEKPGRSGVRGKPVKSGRPGFGARGSIGK
jgi:hypothetical protein